MHPLTHSLLVRCVCACVSQGCRPLNDNTYTIHRLQSSDGGRKKVVLVADARGGVIAPVEALQQDLMQKSKERVEM